MRQIRLETGVCHFRVPAAQDLRTFLENVDLSDLALNFTQDIETQVAEWLYRGAVYVDGRRVRENAPLEQNALIRLHTRPKSYRRLPLKERLVFENDDFLVLDKPAGLPTHATLDNYIENAKFLLEQELGCPLWTTHRLDIATEGLLILAKTSPAQKLINRLFALRLVHKIYYATCEQDVALGEYTHYIEPVLKAPRPISLVKQEGWWECRLVIEKVESGHRHRVRLLTGKTHQIRAQFAALGSPLLGDELYGGRLENIAHLGLVCAELSFRYHGQHFEIVRPGSR